jgi:hypothetical protein
LASEAAVGAMVVVVVLLFLELVVEDLVVVDELPFQESVELFGVDGWERVIHYTPDLVSNPVNEQLLDSPRPSSV